GAGSAARAVTRPVGRARPRRPDGSGRRPCRTGGDDVSHGQRDTPSRRRSGDVATGGRGARRGHELGHGHPRKGADRQLGSGHVASPASAEELEGELAKSDVVITTYATAVRDI